MCLWSVCLSEGRAAVAVPHPHQENLPLFKRHRFSLRGSRQESREAAGGLGSQKSSPFKPIL